MKKYLLLSAFFMAASGHFAPARAMEDDARRYLDCLLLAEKDPGRAFAEATDWEALGGGTAARYCAQVALLGLGRYGEAAQGFEVLAKTVRRDATFKARLLVRAGEAWLALGADDRALAALDTALKLDPGAHEALVLRARVFAAKGAYWEASDDLGRALDINPDDAGVLAMRASAWRHIGSMELARIDGERALAINPGHPGALLEMGNIERLEGNDALARGHWQAVIGADPESPAAMNARQNLGMLDGN